MAGTPDKHPGGRPTAYHKAYDKLVYELCRQHGYGDEKLAELLGVGLTTLKRWKEKYPEFRTALQGGKDLFDWEHIESSLVKRAQGFVRKRLLKRTYMRAGVQQTETTEVVEEVAGSVDAQKFWLVNRNPERWKQVIRDWDEAAAQQQQDQKPGLLIIPAEEEWEKWKQSHQPDLPTSG